MKMKRTAWWADGDAVKGEPVPCYKGEVAVVRLDWTVAGWKLTLSNGIVHECKTLSSVGWDSGLKDVTVFLLPDGLGNEKQFRNAVPKAIRNAAYEARSKHQKKEAKKAQENLSPSIPITREQGIDTRREAGYSTKVPNHVPSQGLKEKQAMAKTLKVSRAKVVELFQALDFKTADKWNDKRLVEKMQGLPTMVDDDTDAEDEELNKLLKDLLKAMEKDTGIELTADDDGAEEEEAEEEKPAKKPAKKAPAKAAKEEEEEDEEEAESNEDDEEEGDEDSDEDDSEDEAEEEEEEEEEEVKPAKKPAKAPKEEAKPAKKPAKAAAKADDDEEEDEKVPVKKEKKAPPKPGKKGPGVIQTIIACLRKASEKKPTTKDAILAVLVETFPEREEKAMKSTISSQIPSGLKVEKGLIVQSNDKGVWLPKEE